MNPSVPQDQRAQLTRPGGRGAGLRALIPSDGSASPDRDVLRRGRRGDLPSGTAHPGGRGTGGFMFVWSENGTLLLGVREGTPRTAGARSSCALTGPVVAPPATKVRASRRGGCAGSTPAARNPDCSSPRGGLCATRLPRWPAVAWRRRQLPCGVAPVGARVALRSRARFDSSAPRLLPEAR